MRSRQFVREKCRLRGQAERSMCTRQAMHRPLHAVRWRVGSQTQYQAAASESSQHRRTFRLYACNGNYICNYIYIYKYIYIYTPATVIRRDIACCTQPPRSKGIGARSVRVHDRDGLARKPHRHDTGYKRALRDGAKGVDPCGMGAARPIAAWGHLAVAIV